LERVVVLVAVFAVVIVVLVLAGVCVYAIRMMKPDRLSIEAGTGQKAIFKVEMSQGRDPAPREERRELEAGRDKPRALETGDAPHSASLTGAMAVPVAADSGR
jgi:hypothetical protein